MKYARPAAWSDAERRRGSAESPDGEWLVVYSADGVTAHVEVHGCGGDAEPRRPAATGFRKWDGCFEFEVSAHVCDREELASLLAAVLAAYDAPAGEGWER